MPEILITPISKTYKKSGPCSKTDWEEQLIRSSNFQQMMWDDSTQNKSKIGDFLAVWHYKKGVAFHYITDIKNPQKRLPSWSRNVGQSNRNVIYISREFAYIYWNEWIKIGGPARCMGTTSVKKAKQSIFNYLLDNSENIKNKLIQFCGGSVKVNLDL